MKVLVACEFSGRVRDAFIEQGHEAYSCDFSGSLGKYTDFHLKTNVLNVLEATDWDLMIAFPPCTYLAVSGARWNVDPVRRKKQEKAFAFVKRLIDAPIPKVAIENPVGRISTMFGMPSQIIHPWQFGHAEAKTTCLWYRQLPPLRPTKVLEMPARGYWENQTPSGQNRLSPSPDRARERSLTYKGIAEAMATQWGSDKQYGFFY